MQNHAPYPDLYGSENEFHGVNETPDTVPERGIIATYAKNVQRTDEATANFLNELDGIDKPITVAVLRRPSAGHLQHGECRQEQCTHLA